MYKNEQGLKVGHDKMTCVITCVFKLITKWSFIILPTQHCHCWLQWAATPAELLWMSAFPRAGKLTGNHTRLAAESVNNWCSQGRQRKSFMEQQSILFLFLLGGKNNFKAWVLPHHTIWRRILSNAQRTGAGHTTPHVLGIIFSRLCERRNWKHRADCYSLTDEVRPPLKLFTEL